MVDSLKKAFFMGLGVGVMVKENMEKRLSDVLEIGKSQAENAAQSIDELQKRVLGELKNVEDKGAAEAAKIIETLEPVSRKEFDALRKRVVDLEAALGAKPSTDPNPEDAV